MPSRASGWSAEGSSGTLPRLKGSGGPCHGRSPLERRLAAILAADVVGYSRLMERDEAGTLARLKAHRKELRRAARRRAPRPRRQAHGRRRALRVRQRRRRGRSARSRSSAAWRSARRDVPEEERIRFRIGINLGDVIVEEDGDLYGDGVNIAARLEQLAEPGGIVVSGTAYDHLQGKLDCGLVPLGEQRLKNIERPVRAYRVELGAGTTVPAAAAASPPARQARRRRAAVRQPERRPGAGLLQRRHHRGRHHRAVPLPRAARDRPQLLLRLPRQGRGRARDRPRARRRLRRRGQRAASRGAGADHRPAHRRRPPARTCGRSATTGRSRTCSRSRTRSRAASSPPSPPACWRRARPPRGAGRRGTCAPTTCSSRATACRTRSRPRRRSGPGSCSSGRASSTRPSPAPTRGSPSTTSSAPAMPASACRASEDPDRAEALRLAEQALALDPNDPRVHYALGYICLTWRDFDRAERHLDLARAMNPNDAQIQIVWAWAQACLGEAERGLPAAELAMRLNPRHPRYYEHYLSRDPVPRPAPRRGGGDPRAAHGRGAPRAPARPGLAGGGLRPPGADGGGAAVRRAVRRGDAPGVARRPGGGPGGVRGLAGRPLLPAPPRGRGAPARGPAAGRPAGLIPRLPGSRQETLGVPNKEASGGAGGGRRAVRRRALGFGWQKRAENHCNPSYVKNVTQMAGYEPIAGTIPGGPVAVTQPITFSLLRKSRHTGDFVTAGASMRRRPTLQGLTGNFALRAR